MHGEVVFSVADDKKEVMVDFGTEIEPTKIVRKGDIVLGNRVAPNNIWMYQESFDTNEQFLPVFEDLLCKLIGRGKYIKELLQKYNNVSLKVYLRSDFGQLGFVIPPQLIDQINRIGCSLEIDILSGGGVLDE